MTPVIEAEQRAEWVREWLRQNWDPELTLAQWWERLASAGLSVPHWPRQWGGLDWSRRDAATVGLLLRERGLPGAPAGLGIMLAGPTLLQHGSDDQRAKYLPDIIRGRTNWCQLFSEPDAGSDLAGVRTRAEPAPAGWTVSGQKVWTSNAQLAEFGMLLARTGNGPKRHNLTWFVLAMDQPSIEVRPLREMTGRSLFTEVFIDGATVSADDVVGAVDGGWAVARTTLQNERLGLAAGGAVGAIPGRRGGMLDARAGDFRRNPAGAAHRSSGTSLAMRSRAFSTLLELYQERQEDTGHACDELARLQTLEWVAQACIARPDRRYTRGGAAVKGSIVKLLSSEATRLARDIGMNLLGSQAMVLPGDRSLAGVVGELCLFAPAVSIYGGTDQIQRNVLAERGLGFPRDSELPAHEALE